MFLRLLLLALSLWLTACGGAGGASSGRDAAHGGMGWHGEAVAIAHTRSSVAESDSVGVASTGSRRNAVAATFDDRAVSGSVQRDMLLAQAAPSPVAAAESGPAAPAEPEPRADGSSGGPILIYSGTVQLSIFSVQETQARIIEHIEELEGWVSDRGPNRLVLRVPAARFREALDLVSAQGDVLQVDWRAQDVSEEYTDLQIRLRNALEMRQRLEELLARAEAVEDLLKIEEQMQRVTLEIETLTGRMRSLNDRIAFSTITVMFAVRQPQQLPNQAFRLPVSFLQNVGLRSLTRL